MNLSTYIQAGGPGSGRKPKLGSDEAKQAAWLDKRQTSIFGPKHTEEIQKNAQQGKTRTWKAQAAGWYAFDFDGTLVEGEKGTFDPSKMGKPIPKMVNLLKQCLAKGQNVKIFTARAGSEVGRDAVERWCMKYVGRKLPVTDRKDHLMIKLYDDKAENPDDVHGFGTSEGVAKSWDSRFRHGVTFRQAREHMQQRLHDAKQRGDSISYAKLYKRAERSGMFLSPEELRGAGTSEGVEKAWDSRQRAGESLKQNGWKTKYSSAQWSQFHNPDHQGHTLAVHRYMGNWVHNKDGQKQAWGGSLSSLADHLKTFHGKSVNAYGTSQGASHAWDTRGRGRHYADVAQNAGFQPSGPHSFGMVDQNGFHDLTVRHGGGWKINHDDGTKDKGESPRDFKHFMRQYQSGTLHAYGTSEGLKKAWDARGRGKNTMGERNPKVRAKQSITLPSGAILYKGRPAGEKPATPPRQGIYPLGAKGGYGTVKQGAGRLWPEQAFWKGGHPDAGVHPLAGKFEQANRQLNPQRVAIEDRKGAGLGKQSTVLYAATDHAGDKAATIFVEHHDHDDTGRVVEFNHDAAGRMQYGRKLLPSLGDTQIIRFNSGQAQSTFLRQRYGIDKSFK